ncbi:intein-containing cytoplasmic dynein 1 heavy chain 1 precursor [Anaeramoeba ignava]|uniref:Intein-containing cytoplasmic dynein 1 heavy chain 1 n=1 Tax=Anaeramoeba ignava TaxID=1746090 RepID=A0A9Q0RFH9_ANAIG|nr:intein-containing cytoplasmic dynein 1 heavy chain 1 precursor [Anaeramoeba ignava]
MQPHYVYSPRELSRWTRSLREILKPLGGDLDLDGLVRIFVHEGLRLFQDRLVYKEERDWTDEQLDSVSKKYFKKMKPKAIERPILFSDWLSKDYMDVDREKLREHVKARLKVFYEEELDVKLVLFNEALDHILRIDRVLKQPQGHCLLIGSSGAGKCLDPNTPVMLYNGKSKLAKNIKVNDQLMGDDSNPRNVLSICKGRENMYRIKQSNGDEYIVNEPHILSLKLTINSILNHEKDLKRYSVLYFENHCEKIKYFNYGKKRKLSESKSFTSSLNALHFANKFINQILESKKYNHKGDVIDIAVIDYIKKPQIWKKYHVGFKVPIQFNSNPNIPIDPYNLGIYLGMENNKSDEEIKIPQCYKINDRETRLNILAGLIDSNDEIIYDEMNNCYNIPINENQEELYKDIQFISRSLGFSCEKEKEKEQIIISGNEIEEIPVRNPNKKIRNQNKIQNSNLESEIEVELIGEGDYCGFEIDGNRRFLLGDFTVTHNTVLSRFVAWMNGLSVFQIKISRKYTLFDFDEDLRVVMKRAGIKGEKICFIFDESNILETSFLERMNALLASGEVPGLFEGDEMGALMNQCREAAISDGVMLDTDDELFNWFTKQVQNNLHIVFTMNPATGDFSNRAATSPALFNRCVLDWFGDWSPSAMYQVGYEFTKYLDLENPNYTSPIHFPHEFDAKDNFPDSPNHRESIVSSFVTIHKSVEKVSKKLQKTQGRSNYVTPRHYLDFITHYVDLFNEKRSSLEEQQLHLNVGLKKMKETEEEVAKLQSTLTIKGKELESKNEEAEAKLKQMVKDQQEAEAKRKVSLEIQTKLESQNKEIAEQQKIAMDDLSKAEPAVLAAKKSVNSIKKRDLEELKSMANPPELVKMTLQGVSQFLGSKDTSWGEIRRLLRKDDFIPSVVNFDTYSIKPKIRTSVEKILSDPKFNFENVNRASKACGPMQKWLEAQAQYSGVISKVEPLRKQVASLEKKANTLRDKQKELNDMIENLEKSIQRYKEEYAQLISQTQEIKSEMTVVSRKVERSIALMKSLSSELGRWSLESKGFQEQMSTVPGDVLLSATFLTYIGFFDQHYRQVLMNIWKKHLMTVNIKYKEGLSLIEYLSVPDDRLIWQSNSLPADDLCTENAIILTRFNRYPLVIDPSGQATEFLMRQFESSKIMKTSFLDDSFMKNLESALRFGTAILLQDVENIDPILNPILNKEVHKTGGRFLIRLGDQEIDFSPSFNLFMTTRDPSFNFTPDLCSRVTFCNFTVTLESLQAQCLNHILRNERPDIDQQRSDILKLQGEYKVRLRNLEKSVLDALNKVVGNILDDDYVFNSLERLKTEAAEVAEKANQADQTLENITKISAKYEPFALSSSRIYFTLEQLSSIHYLYQYSLNFFLGIFFNVVNIMNENIMNVKDYEERLKILTHDLFKVIYRRVSYGLLHKDRLTFALRLAQIYLKQKGQDFDEEEMNLLLRSDIILSPNKLQDKIDNSYYNIPESVIPSSQIKYLQIISELPSFKELPSHIRMNQSEWKRFIKSTNPESNIPENWEKQYKQTSLIEEESERNRELNVKKMLRRLLLLKFFRPDRVLSGTSSLVETVFGYNIQSIPELNLRNVIEKESNAREPLLLCTQPGYDPSTRVDELANELQVKKRSIAIGSQESYHLAEQAIETASKMGTWVLIKNVHLAPPWLNQIEKRVRNINPEPGFRLFMTSEFNPKLPVNFLRLCQIFVFEAPPGIKANLSHTFSLLSSKRVDKAPVERARMHFILSWLHAVIQERLRYVPLGWSKIYEFNEADQRCSLDSIDYWVESVAKGRSNVNPEEIPWIAIRTILGQVMYGGRINNDFDQQLLDSMLERLLVPKIFSSNFKLIEYDSLTEDGFDKFSLEIPKGTKMEHFADWIEKLPKNENPAWLGLPAKAELLLLANQGKETLANFLKMENIYEEEKSDIEKEKKEDRRPSWMKKLEKSTREWIDILPKSLDSLKKTESSIKDPLFRCFNREIIIGKKLLNKVREDLEKILLLCQGKQKHTNYLRGLIRDLTQATIPSSWRVYSVANIPVGIWIVDFSKRIKQLQKIILSKNYCLDGIWLGGLFSPEAFITATRQSAAQSNMWSLETLKLEIEIGKFTQSKFKNTSFFVDDFTLEGAIWKNNCLAISSDISNPLPRVQLRWVPNQENELNVKSKVGSDLINLPVYLNNTRKELLFSLDLTTPKDVPIQTWYQRGTALIVWSSPD